MGIRHLFEQFQQLLVQCGSQALAAVNILEVLEKLLSGLLAWKNLTARVGLELGLLKPPRELVKIWEFLLLNCWNVCPHLSANLLPSSFLAAFIAANLGTDIMWF